MKKIVLICLLILSFSIALFSSEKKVTIKNKITSEITQKSMQQNSVVNFSKLFNTYKVKPLANLIEKTSMFSSLRGIAGKHSLFKAGVNLLINGIAWGLTGMLFIGIGFVLIYLYAQTVGVSFATALATLFIVFALTDSTYAYAAVALFVCGIILSIFWVLIIPGIILMIVGSVKRASNLKPLTDVANTVGFSIKLGHNY